MENLQIAGVTEAIVKHLRVHIIDGALKPGQKLNEIELSTILGVSRPPLREAFRILENEHLIISNPRRGCYVTELSTADCREIFEAREMIECYAVDLLKEKKIKKLPKLTAALRATEDLPMPMNRDPFERYNYLKAIANFHIGLVESAGNSRLNSYYFSNFYNLARYQSMYVFIDGLMNRSQEIHEQLLHLIENEKYTQSKKLLKNHIKGFLSILEKKIQENKTIAA